MHTLACYKLDRIGRSLAHLSKLLADLDGRGVHFRTVEDGLDTSGSTGRLVFGAVAQFERDLIIERTRAGLASAQKRGKRLGPPV
jgi:DNA invertase Pin-like site-specific DNA recombinase